jgi:hypothetical protein
MRHYARLGERGFSAETAIDYELSTIDWYGFCGRRLIVEVNACSEGVSMNTASSELRSAPSYRSPAW